MAQRYVTIKVRPEDTVPGGPRRLIAGPTPAAVLAQRIGDGATGALRHLAGEIRWGALAHELWNG